MANEEQEIKFPLEWQYRIIVESIEEPVVLDEIKKIINSYCDNEDLIYSHSSSSGTYKTYSFKKVVNSKEEMNEIAEKISAIKGVKVVI